MARGTRRSTAKRKGTITVMGFNPENKERPNASEQKPKKEPSEQTIRGLGAAAIKGSQRSR